MEAFFDLLKDIWDFMKVRKKYWLAPLIITIVLMGALIVLTQGSVVAPFIYTNLLFTTIWGFVLFGNFPDFWTIVGALIIVAAGIYVWARDRAVRQI